MRKVLVARGGIMSTFSGLGSTHEKLVSRLDSDSLSNYTLGSVHEYNSSNNPVRKLYMRWSKGPRDVARMSKEYDIVHISDQEQAGMVPRNAKTVVTVHDLFHIFPSVRNNIEIGEQKPGIIRRKDLEKIKSGLLRADLLICISKDTQQECEMRFPGVKTAYIPHAIDTEKYQIDTQRPRWFNSGVNLLVVGSEESRKRVDFAIDVCSGMDVTLHKIGAESSSEAKNRLQQYAKSTGCNLNWVGALEEKEMIAALQHADALLFPSVAEGFGLPPLEAYAAGTVALVANAPAHNEIPLRHHILPIDNVEDWKEAIRNLKDESKEVLAKAKMYSIEAWCERLSEAYDSILQ